jgi:hypothetical protein
MLGHASLDTTAGYAHVAIRALKEVHERTHPGAMLGKSKAKVTTPTSPKKTDTKALLSTVSRLPRACSSGQMAVAPVFAEVPRWRGEQPSI